MVQEQQHNTTDEADACEDDKGKSKEQTVMWIDP